MTQGRRRDADTDWAMFGFYVRHNVGIGFQCFAGGLLAGAALLLAKASGPSQEAAIGNQTGGRVFLFLETNNFDRDYQHMLSEGVKFREAPRSEAYGRVVVFEDVAGNLWDLIEPK